MPIFNPPTVDGSNEIADHEQAADPHRQYLTGDEANTAISAAVTDHEQAADPHPQYAAASVSALQILDVCFPVGSWRWWHHETNDPATGVWLTLDGSTVSKSTYSALWNSDFQSHLTDNQDGTITLPNWGGLFIRSTGDIDSASRTARGDGNVGNLPGTFQEDAIKAHTHRLRKGNQDGSNSASGVLRVASSTRSTDEAPMMLEGATETRVKNISQRPIVRVA